MAVGIFVITFDRNQIETWGFYHSTEDRRGHPDMTIFIGQYIDQSDDFLNKHYSDNILRSISDVGLPSNTIIR